MVIWSIATSLAINHVNGIIIIPAQGAFSVQNAFRECVKRTLTIEGGI